MEEQTERLKLPIVEVETSPSKVVSQSMRPVLSIVAGNNEVYHDAHHVSKNGPGAGRPQFPNHRAPWLVFI